MKIRQKMLLNIIISKKIVNINVLADDFGVSSRTIRNDYKIIKDYLNSILKKTCLDLCNNNIGILITDEELEIIHKSIKTCGYYLYKLSSFERGMIIISELVYNNDYVTIETLAEKMYVSRGTINKDLVQVRNWCNKNSIEILAKKANGLKINVNEKKRRSIIAKLISDSNDMNNPENLSNEIDICKKFFKNIDLMKVKDLVIDAENKYELVLSDVVFEALTIHIGLSIERSLEHLNINLDKDVLKIEKKGIEYQMSKYLISEIETTFNVKMPEIEIYYIALHILGKVILEKAEESNDNWLDIQIIITNLIKKVSVYTGYRFENDTRLNDGLYNHLSATLFHLTNNAEYKNPFKIKMFNDYPNIYKAIQANIDELQNYWKVKLSDDEIAYIVLHFAASIERNKQKAKIRIARVIILCSTGLGTARMVQSRVSQCFKLNIVRVLALHQLKQLISYENADFIISTVPVKAEIPVIQVSPLINEKEVQKISDLLIGLGFSSYLNEVSNEFKSNILARQVIDLLETCPSDKELKSNLKRLLRNQKEDMNLQHNEKDRKGSVSLMLSDVLKEEYITLGDVSKTWEEAVENAGIKLLENNVITRDYINATIKNVKENGPYIVITKGVAIPHASNKLGVAKTAISLVRLNEGINFGNEENDPVKYIFMLATINASSHIQALSELVTLLSEQKFYKIIDSAISPKEIINYIKNFEKN